MRVFVLALTVLGVGLFSTACEFSVSTASLSEVKTCVEPEADSGLCDEDQEIFATDVPQITVTAELNSAPEGTELTFLWRYMEGEGEDIDSVAVVSQDGTNTVQSSLLSPDSGWPPGEYEVILDLDTDDSDSILKSFRVE